MIQVLQVNKTKNYEVILPKIINKILKTCILSTKHIWQLAVIT